MLTNSSDLIPSFSGLRTEAEIITMEELPKVHVSAPLSLVDPVGNAEESHEVVIVAESANTTNRRSAKERLGKRKSVQDRLHHNKKKF